MKLLIKCVVETKCFLCGRELRHEMNVKDMNIYRCPKCDVSYSFVGEATERHSESCITLQFPKLLVHTKNMCPICHAVRDNEGRCRCRGNNVGYQGSGGYMGQGIIDEKFEMH